MALSTLSWLLVGCLARLAVDPACTPAEEAVDGADQDCDGRVDEDTVVFDDDGDGVSEVDGDCDDANAQVSPALEEEPYDGLDNDCVDGDLADVDGDGHDGELAFGYDCDDGDPDVNPDAEELRNGTDDDCDGVIDEGFDPKDLDGDGFTPSTGDCDELDAAVNPGAPEVCNDGADNDCDGTAWPCPFAPGELAADRAVAWWAPAEGKVEGVGAALFGLPDMTGDGLPDLLVGTAGAAEGWERAWMAPWPGPGGHVLDEEATTLLTGSDDLFGLGRAACAADLDEDGSPELLLGLPQAEEDAGQVLWLHGPLPAGSALELAELLEAGAAGRVEGSDEERSLGSAVATAEDLLGRGSPTLVWVAGSASQRGRVYLVPTAGLTSASSPEALAAATVQARADGDRLGTALASEDLDGDALVDLVLSAPADATAGPDAGAVLLFAGPLSGELEAASADVTLLGDPGTAAGDALATGECDGDGLADLVVGVASADRALVLLGPQRTGEQSLVSAADARLLGHDGSRAGTHLAVSPDLDDDGNPDLLIGGPAWGGSGQGIVYVHYGLVAGNVDLFAGAGELRGAAAQDLVGLGLAVLGDADGDGRQELATSGPGRGDGLGGVFLVRGDAL